MSTKSLVSDLSANTINKIGNATQSALFFFVISIWLTKDELGIYAWCLSVATILAEIVTLGIHQPVVRRIAAGVQDANLVSGVALSSRSMLALALALVGLPLMWFIRGEVPHLGLLFFAYAAMVVWVIASVSQHVLQAKEQFWYMMIALQAGLMVKLLLGLLLVRLGYGVPGLFTALLISSLVIGCLGFGLANRTVPRAYLPRWDWLEFKQLIREGLPLLASLLMNQTLARADWILIRVFYSDEAVGEYAFAYRLFEFSWLPHAVLSVILLPRLSYWLRGGEIPVEQGRDLQMLVRVIIAISALIPLNMVIAWTPVMDFVTSGKYGAVNQMAITILSLSTPFIAGAVMYTGFFVATVRTKQKMLIMIGASVFNVGLNLVLIPKMGGVGAALATALAWAGIFMAGLLIFKREIKFFRLLITMALLLGWAVLAVIVVRLIGGPWVVQCALATAIYVSGMLITDGVPWRETLVLLKQPSAQND
jgi:O-antigen/teichoic acid export membrane protein